MDLSKLTPAPWWHERRYSNECETVPRIRCTPDAKRECGWVADLIGAPYLGYESTLVNAEFIALARNAFDVMMRRGWGVYLGPDGWGVSFSTGFCGSQLWDRIPKAIWYGRQDPFTALVEADRWYRENVEKAHTAK